MTRRSFLAAAAAPLLAQDILTLAPPKANARIPYGKAPQQFGDIFLPHGAGPHQAVIFIHGGFWRNAYSLDHAGHLCAALAQAGAAVWSLEYRRLGDPGGDWAGMSDDIVHGAQHLVPIATRYNLDLKRVIAAGHSAGGQLALWLAAQQAVDLRGVVPLAAVSDLRRAFALQLNSGVVGELMGGSPDRVPQRYAAADPMELLPIPAPQRVIHGTADDIVPFDMSQRFAKASKNSKLIPLAGAGHFDLIDPRAKVWPVIQKNILEWEF
ncbi:MAG: alpha/beta hydrolase family protein [Bryobacteraceae bacterium]